jgi:outer membrane protein assembly factor BamB
VPQTTAATCPDCASAQPVTARWCGHCGTPLGTPPGPSLGTRGGPEDGPPPAPVLGTDEAPDHPPPTGGDGWVALAPDEQAPAPVVEETLPEPDHRRRVLVGSVALALLAGLVTAQTLREPRLPELGMSARGDAGLSGVTTAVTPPPPAEVLWTRPLAVPSPVPVGTIVLTSAPAVVTVDTVGTSGLVGYDGVTGQFRWQRADLPGLLAAPVELTPDGQHLLVPTLGATIVLDAATGQEVWRNVPRIDDPVVTPAGIASTAGGRVLLLDTATGEPLLGAQGTPVVPGIGVLATGTPDGLFVLQDGSPGAGPVVEVFGPVPATLALVDVATGERRFEVPLVDPLLEDNPRIGVTPGQTVAADDRAIAVLGPLSVTTHDARTGELVGTVPHGVGDVRSLAVTVGRPAVADRSGRVRVFEPDTGEVRWTLAQRQIDPDRPLTSPPSLRSDGRILQVSAPGTVAVVDGLDGTLLNRARLAPEERRFLSADAGVSTFDDDGTLTVTTADGRERFSVEPVLPPAPAPVVRDGRVVVATAEGVAVLDLSTGEMLWQNASFLGSRAHHGALRTPAVTDDEVVLSPPDAEPFLTGGLVGFEVDTGILVWRREDERPVRGEPTLDRDIVFLPVSRELHGYEARGGRRGLAARAGGARVAVAAGAGHLVATTPGGEGSGVVSAVLRADRSRTWTVQRPVCSPPAIRDGRVVVGSQGGVAALDLVTGGVLWEATTPPVCTPPALDAATVVVATGPARLSGIAVADGTVLWQASLPAPAVSPPTLAGGTAVVALLDGSVVGVDTSTGSLAWQRLLPGTPAGGVTVTDAGTILVTLRDGTVTATGTRDPDRTP